MVLTSFRLKQYNYQQPTLAFDFCIIKIWNPSAKGARDPANDPQLTASAISVSPLSACAILVKPASVH